MSVDPFTTHNTTTVTHHGVNVSYIVGGNIDFPAGVGYDGDKALELQDSTGYINIFNYSQTEGRFSVRYKCPHTAFPSVTDNWLMGTSSNTVALPALTPEPRLGVRALAGGVLEVYRFYTSGAGGPAVIASSISRVMRPGAWHKITFAFKIGSGANGEVTVLVDDVVALVATGLDLVATGHFAPTTHDWVTVGVHGGGSGSANTGGYYRDYVYHGNYSTTTRVGDLRVYALTVDGAGYLQDSAYVPVGAATQYEAVDDTPPDLDSTYLSVLGHSHSSTFNLTDMPEIDSTATIPWVEAITYQRYLQFPLFAYANTVVGIRLSTAAGATSTPLMDNSIANGVQPYHSNHSTNGLNPMTGTAWSRTTVNTLQVGFTSGSEDPPPPAGNEAYCTSVVAFVLVQTPKPAGTILYLDPFDSYATAQLDERGHNGAYLHSSTPDNPVIDPVGGYGGKGSLYFEDTTRFLLISESNVTSRTWGFWWRCRLGSLPAVTDHWLTGVAHDNILGPIPGVSFRVLSNGAIEAYDLSRSVSIATSAAGALVAGGVWQRIQISVRNDGSHGGMIYLFVGDVAVLSVAWSGSLFVQFQYITLGIWGGGSGTPLSVDYDHLFIASGETWLLEPWLTTSLWPNAPGLYTLYESYGSGSTGLAHWELVGEHPPDGDVTAVRTVDGNSGETYNIESLTRADSVYHVQLMLYHRWSASLGSVEFTPLLLLDVSHQAVGFFLFGLNDSTSYGYKGAYWTQNPFTFAPWEVADLDSLQIGTITNVSGGTYSYLSQAVLEVLYVGGLAVPVRRAPQIIG